MRDGVRGAPDVSALASLAPKKLAIMVWHYHDDDVPGPDAGVQLAVNGLPQGVQTCASRTTASTTRTATRTPSGSAWVRRSRRRDRSMSGSKPLASSSARRAVGRACGGGTAALEFALPRQAVSLLVLEWD